MNLGQPNYAESNDQTPLLPSENSKRRQRRSVKKPKLNVSTTKVEAPLPLEKYRLLGQQNNPASGAGNNIKRDRHPLLSGSNEVRESVTQEESSAAKPKKNIRSSYVPMGSQLKEPRGNCKRPGAHLSLEYSTKNHYEIICRCFGSIWPKVVPFCVTNVIITIALKLLSVHIKDKFGFNILESDRGHKFMSILASFLTVTRVNIAYNRYMEYATLMFNLFVHSRELVMNAITYSRKYRTHEAMDWRSEICRRVIVLLRVTVSILEYHTKREHPMKLPGIKEHEQEGLTLFFGEARERYPFILSLFLRSCIGSHEELFGIVLQTNERLKLLQNNTDYLTQYHGMVKLMSTPFPFPLVQMSRTFLFFWLFTLPLAMLHELRLLSSCIIIFFMTFGFVGLELVAMELDDPFGNDENDLEVYELSKVVYDDICIFLYDCDGAEMLTLLKEVVDDPKLANQVKKNYKTHVRRRTYAQDTSSALEGVNRARTLSDTNVIEETNKSAYVNIRETIPHNLQAEGGEKTPVCELHSSSGLGHKQTSQTSSDFSSVPMDSKIGMVGNLNVDEEACRRQPRRSSSSYSSILIHAKTAVVGTQNIDGETPDNHLYGEHFEDL